MASNAHGAKPLRADLARIAALRCKEDLPALMAYLSRSGVTTRIALDVCQDAKDATRYAVNASQSGLGLPDRDYYLKDDDVKLKTARSAYRKHVETLLATAGDTQAAVHAADVPPLETALANVQWTRVKSCDALKTNNSVAFDKLAEPVPDFDWKAYLAAAGLSAKTDFLVVRQPSYLTALADVLRHSRGRPGRATSSLASAGQRRTASVQRIRRRALCLHWQDATRCAREQTAMATGPVPGRYRNGRGGGPVIRCQVPPTGEQGARAGHRQQLPGYFPRRH